MPLPDLELCAAAARPAQKVPDRNASEQREPVLLDGVLTMPTLHRPVLSQSKHASQIQSTSDRTELRPAILERTISSAIQAPSLTVCVLMLRSGRRPR